MMVTTSNSSFTVIGVKVIIVAVEVIMSEILSGVVVIEMKK